MCENSQMSLYQEILFRGGKLEMQDSRDTIIFSARPRLFESSGFNLIDRDLDPKVALQKNRLQDVQNHSKNENARILFFQTPFTNSTLLFFL